MMRYANKKRILPFALSFCILMFTFSIGSLPEEASAATFGVPSNYLTLGTGLVGHWTMDGGDVNWTTGAVKDRSGNGVTGYVQNMSTTTAPSGGALGQAFDFDGVDDYVYLGNRNEIEGLESMTVALWVKADTALKPDADILICQCGGGAETFELNWTSNENIDFIVRDTGDIGFIARYTNGIVDTEWHFVVGVLDGANNIVSVYVDGVVGETTVSFTDVTGSSVNSLVISSAGSTMNGALDDARIYNRALRADEIKALYQSGSVTVGVSRSANPADSLSQGLVGHWTMDGPDVNWATGAVNDRSGNGNNGYLQGLMPTTSAPTIGGIGQALTFDGVDDFVNAGSGSSLDDIELQGGGGMSASFWVKPDSNTTARIMMKGPDSNNSGFWSITKTSTTYPARITFSKEGGTDAIATYNSVLVSKEWQHIVFTWNGSMTFSTGVLAYKNGVLLTQNSATDGASGNSDSSNNLVLGSVNGTSQFFDGALDDVRVYNRILRPDEVKRLYEQSAGAKQSATPTGVASTGLNAGLVGHWTFDGPDVSWTTGAVKDRSGNGNTGYVIGMSTTSSPVFGWIGQAFTIDTSLGSVYLGSPASLANLTTRSACAWVFPNIYSSDYPTILSSISGATGWDFYLRRDDNFGFGTSYFDTGADYVYREHRVNGSVKPNTWNHLCYVQNGNGLSNLSLYLNGEQVAGANTSPGTTGVLADESGNNRYIGNDSGGGNPSGTIDDVRIYNRALSADEIRQLYTMGR